jgi:flavin-binding protein dodecin
MGEDTVAEPFRPAAEKGSSGWLLRSKRSDTFEAIEDALARCTRVSDVGADAIDALCSGFGVDISRRFASDRKHLYRRYLAYCLEDRVLSAEENADLKHLGQLLHLDEATLHAVHDEVAHEVYGKAVQEVLEDLQISPEEDAFLRRLRGELHLSDTEAERMLERSRESARDAALREASAIDPEFTGQRPPAGAFIGRSDESFEAAVSDALAKAQVAIPQLHWFEVTNVSGYVGDGKPSSWHVTVRGGIKTS